MNLVAYTATALSRNDIADTPTNKNIVDGAIVELKDLDGNLVVIYDDESGSNPETQKSCNTNGQLTFWAEVGDYILIINGEVNFITIGASVKFTKQSRQAIEAAYKAQGYNNVFFFEDGFTYTESNDVGVYEDGTAWTYADTGALPVTIAAGTVPTEGIYSKAVMNDADSITNSNGGSVQQFIDSFALKIFQSPTDGGLTEVQTRTVGAGEVYEVRKTSDDSLATIYSDAAGATEIVQNGTNNVSDSAGVVEFFVADGDYYAVSHGKSNNFSVDVARGVVAVDSIADLLSLPEGQRKEGLRYLVKWYHAGSDVGGGEFYWDASSTVTPDEGNALAPTHGQPGRFIRPRRAVVLLEEFGAAPHLTPAENALRITKCLNALTDGQALGQLSGEIQSERVSKTTISRNNHLELRLKAVGRVALAFVAVENSPGVQVSGRLDADNNEGIVLYMRNCPGAVCGRDLWLGNIQSVTAISAGLFMRDCDESEVRCTVENIYAESSAARGIMISDQTIKKNTSTIAPTVKNIISDNDAVDGDGLYAEYTTEGYIGGLKIVGGHYEDCDKRYIKVNSPRPTIAGNTGRSSLDRDMFALISSYDEYAGDIYDNDMESGSIGAEHGIDMGGFAAQFKNFNVGPNRLVSKVLHSAGKAFGIAGVIGKGRIRIGECRGFQALLLHYGESTYSGQILQIGDGTFDDYAASARNCITVVGDFQKLKVHDIECINDTAARYFVSARELSDYVAEIVDNRQRFSYGRLAGKVGARELNAWEKSSAELNGERVINGTKILKRNSAPTVGDHRIADRVDRQQIHVDANNMAQTGWICTVAGTPGTWITLLSSTVSPAT